ncbi:MAG: glycosyltransferase family 2 protein [Candidatus Omnitrophota bacterium]|nr:glycosyltransferase family 2 protein [Candidatus Omnitrophota bacterium]
MSKHLSVIVPAYNEAHRGIIKTTLESFQNYFTRQNYSWEVIIVSDGSKDRTVEIVSEFISNKPEFSLIANTQNYGKGYVVRQGMLAATGDYRIFVDADNAISVEQIEKFWPFIDEGYEVVIGSIELPGAKIKENAQWYRRFLGKYSKYIIRIVAGLWSIHDTQRAFKLFTARSAVEIFSRAAINRWGFDIEVLVLAKKLGYKIKELPITWINHDESRVNLGSYFGVLRDLFKMRFNLWFGKYKL